MNFAALFHHHVAALLLSLTILLVCLFDLSCRLIDRSNFYHIYLCLELCAHASTGILFWLCCTYKLCTYPDLKCFCESLFWVSLFATVVDVDHFVCAGSFSLQAARSLSGRPFLHWFGLCSLLMCVLVALSIHSTDEPNTKRKNIVAFAWLVLIGSLSHVIRDAAHRGIWIWPPPNRHTWQGPHRESSVYRLEIGVLPKGPLYLFVIIFMAPLFRFCCHRMRWSIRNFAPISYALLTDPNPKSSFCRPFTELTKLLYRKQLSPPKLCMKLALSTTTIRKNEADSKRWLARQNSDPYVRRARIESYRCRSAFKLLQLQNEVPGGILHPADIVVDCGAAPGSWSQVASKLVRIKNDNSKSGLVISFDLLDFSPVPGCVCFSKTDLRNTTDCVKLVEDSIIEHWERLAVCGVNVNNGAPKVDVVLSDMAPDASGLKELDIPAMMNLAHAVLHLAIRISRPGASLVIKVWQSPHVNEFIKLISRFYTGSSHASDTNQIGSLRSSVRVMKPASSRLESSEIYLVAQGFRLPEQAI